MGFRRPRPSHRLTAAMTAALAVPASLGLLSADAAGSVTTAVSLAVPGSAQYGRSVSMGGVLWRYGTTVHIADATIQLQRRIRGESAWTTTATTKTASDGTYRFTVVQSILVDYRAVYAGSTTFTSAASAVRHTVTIPVIDFRSLSSRTGSEVAMVSAVVYPAPPLGTPVYLYRNEPGTSTWQLIDWGRVSDENTGGQLRGEARFQTLSRPGTRMYRLTIAARDGYAAATSGTRSSTHP